MLKDILVFKNAFVFSSYNDSDAISGWPGWALAHPEFWSSGNPITTRGEDFAHHITASPPGFENPAASLPLQKQKQTKNEVPQQLTVNG